MVDADKRSYATALVYELGDALAAITTCLLVFDGPNDPAIDMEEMLSEFRQQCSASLFLMGQLQPWFISGQLP